MLNVSILCVGKLRERYWREACDEYIRRLSPFARVRVAEIPEERCPENPSPAQIAAVLEAEGARLLAALPAQAWPVALCVEGRSMPSEALAEAISGAMVSGHGAAAFFIGGSFGLSPAVKSRAQLRLSMSELTFPHQLARVMLLEQLYRCANILSGGKYHK